MIAVGERLAARDIFGPSIYTREEAASPLGARKVPRRVRVRGHTPENVGGKIVSSVRDAFDVWSRG